MTTPLRTYDTVSEAVSNLVRLGYTANLTVDAEKDCLSFSSPCAGLSPDKFRIDEVYRLEGTVVPAISLLNGKIKGVVVNTFGIYSSYRSSKLINHLSTHLK